MNLFELSGILTFITSISMGVFVLCKTPSNFTNRIWAYFTFCVAAWGISVFFIPSITNAETALFFWKMTYATDVTAIPLLFLYFVCIFLNIQKNLFLAITCLTGLYFSIEILLGTMIKHVGWVFNSFYYPGAPPTFLHIIYFIWWVLVIFYSHYLLITNYRKVYGIKREQIKYFFLATSIGFTGGVTCFFPSLGINLYPYGNLAVPLYPLIMTYAILKYHLMDINVVLRRSLIYSAMVTVITLIFLISVLVSEHAFHHFIHYQNIFSSMITASIIALIFTPLKNQIQNLIDRAFFKATPMEIVYQNEKLKAVATLASGLAHEIKNPLTTLKTFAEYVPKKKDDPEFIRQYEKIVPQEIDRINNLIYELLAFAKPSLPKLQTVNPHEIIKNLLAMCEHRFKSANIKVVTQFNDCIIQADPNQLKQALLNILLNAIDAMPKGGKLTIETSAGHEASYTITITDTGCGIDPKDLPHIFDPFFTKKEKGTGLGLSITQGIIEKHGGKILIESRINQGTIFKIILPL